MLRYDSTAMPHPLVSRAAIVKAAEKAHALCLYKPSLGVVFWILAQAAWLALALPFAAGASGRRRRNLGQILRIAKVV